MAGKSLKIDVRRGKIVALLERDHSVTVAQLSRILGATPVTIRNDLAALEAENRLRRVRGGAITPAPQPGFGALSEEKLAIAEAFALRVQENDRLFINSGSTSRAVCHALRRFHSLAIVTNSPPVARMLSDRFSVVLLGGDLSPDGLFTHGEDALRQLERYQTDWAMLSVDSVSAAEGVSLCHPEECMVSRRMLERAARGVIVADHTKIRRAGFVHICDAAAPLMLVTSRLADADEISALRAAGMEVVLT